MLRAVQILALVSAGSHTTFAICCRLLTGLKVMDVRMTLEVCSSEGRVLHRQAKNRRMLMQTLTAHRRAAGRLPRPLKRLIESVPFVAGG